jgi:tetratricopeptide (TPR) repeat protein
VAASAGTLERCRRRVSEDALTLAQRGHAQRREGRLDDALQSFTEAVAAARREGNDADLVHALKGQGQLERDLGHGDAALPLFEEAVELCLALDDLPGLAHALRHLGDLLREAGRYSAAALPCAQALSLYRLLPATPPLELANALRVCALVRDELGEADAATALWREARALYLVAGADEGVAECERRLG